MSKEFVFRTAPDEIVPFTFTAYGDQGITSYASLAVERALEYEPSLHLHLGDLSYGGAKVSQWIKWFTIIEPLASKSPYMYAIGNHEYDGTGDLTDIKTYFEAPNDETNYGFIWSNVYFLTVDLGPSSSNPASQELISWVESKLIEAANNPLVQWIVVYLHYPPYSSGKAHGSSPAAQPLIPLFDKYGVDLVLAGHEHNYERTYPIRNDMVVSFNSTLYSGIEGTIYIVAGGGGGGLYKEFQSPSPEWSYYRAAEYSILVVSVDGGVMEVKAVNSQTGEIMDSFIIKKGERVSTKSYIDSELDIQLNSTYNIMMLMLTVSLSIAIHRILMAKRISRYN
jgi:predicted phosphohydrolase